MAVVLFHVLLVVDVTRGKSMCDVCVIKQTISILWCSALFASILLPSLPSLSLLCPPSFSHSTSLPPLKSALMIDFARAIQLRRGEVCRVWKRVSSGRKRRASECLERNEAPSAPPGDPSGGRGHS